MPSVAGQMANVKLDQKVNNRTNLTRVASGVASHLAHLVALTGTRQDLLSAQLHRQQRGSGGYSLAL